MERKFTIDLVSVLSPCIFKSSREYLTFCPSPQYELCPQCWSWGQRSGLRLRRIARILIYRWSICNHFSAHGTSHGLCHKYFFCSNIYFKRQYLKLGLIPKYAQIRIPHISPASKNTQKKIHIVRVKDGIKFLYEKKDNFKESINRNHLQAVQE